MRDLKIEFWFAPVSKRVFVQNFSYENDFNLHANELAGETHFHKNGFALRLVFTQRQTRTRKWAIAETPRLSDNTSVF